MAGKLCHNLAGHGFGALDHVAHAVRPARRSVQDEIDTIAAV
jgi:hypothetical protein